MRITSTKNKKLVIGLALAAVVAVNGAYFYQTSRTADKPTVLSSSTTQTAKPVVEPTTHLSYQGQDGKTVLELLKQKASVQTKESSYGEFVVSINGNDGSGKQYWLFYVDGKEASVGAGAYVTKNSESIEWKLQ